MIKQVFAFQLFIDSPHAHGDDETQSKDEEKDFFEEHHDNNIVAEPSMTAQEVVSRNTAVRNASAPITAPVCANSALTNHAAYA